MNAFNDYSTRKNPRAYEPRLRTPLPPGEALRQALKTARRPLDEHEARTAERNPWRHSVCPNQRADQGTVGCVWKDPDR